MKYAVAVLATLVLAVVAPAASAEPPISDDGHTHHVTTGHGGCLDIDAVRFLIEERGLHRGANASGAQRGPWHGAC